MAKNDEKEKKEARKGIAVSPETYERFKRFGRYSDTQDDILNRLLNIGELAVKMVPVLVDTQASSQAMRGEI